MIGQGFPADTLARDIQFAVAAITEISPSHSHRRDYRRVIATAEIFIVIATEKDFRGVIAAALEVHRPIPATVMLPFFLSFLSFSLLIFVLKY